MTKQSSHNAEHNKLIGDALEALAAAGYTAWRSESGVWFEESDEPQRYDANGSPIAKKKGRPHKFGKKGGGDITCIIPLQGSFNGTLAKIGLHCEFEAKTGSGRQSDNQIRHQKFCIERNGGIYFVFRSVEDLFSQMKKYGI